MGETTSRAMASADALEVPAGVALTPWEARAVLHKLGGLTDYSRTAVENARLKLVAVAYGEDDATHFCPECGTRYTCAGRCGYYLCSQPERVELPVASVPPPQEAAEREARSAVNHPSSSGAGDA